MLQPLFSFLVAGSFSWFLASSLWIFPHSLSYFNESIGGPLNGPEHLLGSNVDWGQDARYLSKWIMANERISKEASCALAYRGGFGPSDVGLVKTLPWPRLEMDKITGFSASASHADPAKGRFAISLDLLYGASSKSRDGADAERPAGARPLLYLGEFRNMDVSGYGGYSIRIYDVE